MSEGLTLTKPNRTATGIDTNDIIWVWRTGNLVPTQLALTISGGDLTMTGGNIYFEKGSNAELGTIDDFDMCFIRNSVEHICLEDGLTNNKLVVKNTALRDTEKATSTTESISVDSYTTIRQTTSGISTTLTNAVAGSTVTVINASNGNNTVIGTINGEVDPIIYCSEAFTMSYDGSSWNLK